MADENARTLSDEEYYSLIEKLAKMEDPGLPDVSRYAHMTRLVSDEELAAIMEKSGLHII
jgi:hypothetical protein